MDNNVDDIEKKSWKYRLYGNNKLPTTHLNNYHDDLDWIVNKILEEKCEAEYYIIDNELDELKGKSDDYDEVEANKYLLSNEYIIAKKGFIVDILKLFTKQYGIGEKITYETIVKFAESIMKG